MKKTHDVKLLGQKITLKNNDGDSELTEKVVDLVNRKIKAAESRVKVQSPQQVVLLALLDLAEDYLQARQRTDQFKKQVSSRTQKVRGLLGLAETANTARSRDFSS